MPSLKSTLKLTAGTRSSRLAMYQTQFIIRQLTERNPGLTVDIKQISTTGDRILDKPLAAIGDKGLFTHELEIELLSGGIDFAVHSLKDLPAELPDNLEIACIAKRGEVRDALVARQNEVTISSLPHNAVIATGSTRRKAFLLNIRPDLHIVELRGNVPTRISKFENSDWDAIVLAGAGLQRLNLSHFISSLISVDEIIPSPAQGAIACEIAAGNARAKEILRTINDLNTEFSTKAERSFLRALGGGCKTPIAAYAEINDNTLNLKGAVLSADGKVKLTADAEGMPQDYDKIGEKLAVELIGKGAKDLFA
jgi:hydroxymethylbilane synthase